MTERAVWIVLEDEAAYEHAIREAVLAEVRSVAEHLRRWADEHDAAGRPRPAQGLRHAAGLIEANILPAIEAGEPA